MSAGEVHYVDDEPMRAGRRLREPEALSAAEVEREKKLRALRRQVREAEKKMQAASERRRALPTGSSRSRVTTANARWSTACEAHDRLLRELRELEETQCD